MEYRENYLIKTLLSVCVFVKYLCMFNNSMSIWNLIYSHEISSFTYLLLVTDTLVFGSVVSVSNSIKENRLSLWYTSLYLFFVVLCQIIETMVVIAGGSSAFFTVYELTISCSISALMHYYMKIIMNYYWDKLPRRKVYTVQKKLNAIKND